jgi:organic radical activating enzyme
MELIALFNQINSCFKFVIGNDKDYKEAENFIKKHKIDKDKVYMMPQCTTQEEQSKFTWLVEKCIKNGYNYGFRLQILLWGKQKGR